MNFELSSIVVAGLTAFAFQVSGQSTNDPSSHTYRNPLLPEIEMADPDVIRVNGKYYLYPTSTTRGYDVFVSDDLVHWENRGNVFVDPRHGDWAPDVFYNLRGDKRFYLYYTDNQDSQKPRDKQIGVAVADNPLGPFVDKAVLATNSIDAHLFQDDDGSNYLYYVDLTGGFKIMVQPMANPLQKSGSATGVIHPTESWEKKSGSVTEGPFMLKRTGTYYLMYSGTGADSPNYGIGYATAKSPLGPFTKFAGNPIAHREQHIFGPGHHCVVEGPDRKLWLIYHQKWTDDKSFRRFLAIDPIWFDKDGVIHTRISRDTTQPAP